MYLTDAWHGQNLAHVVAPNTTTGKDHGRIASLGEQVGQQWESVKHMGSAS